MQEYMIGELCNPLLTAPPFSQKDSQETFRRTHTDEKTLHNDGNFRETISKTLRRFENMVNSKKNNLIISRTDLFWSVVFQQWLSWWSSFRPRPGRKACMCIQHVSEILKGISGL